MTDSPAVHLGHFATYRFTPRFWELAPAERTERATAWHAAVASVGDATTLYTLGGIEAGADVMVWGAAQVPDPADAGAYLADRGRAENAHRGFVEPVHVLWGVTRPSEYSRARSAQEIDPFSPERTTYLVVYPFSKTAEWYLMSREARQGLMNEHIRIGKQYREITQWLLYSFGLQDQEFVVVYETEDLSLFSRLVHELRDTEARRYTKLDTPLHTGVLVDPTAWAEGLG